jgi:transposase InsO family protein
MDEFLLSAAAGFALGCALTSWWKWGMRLVVIRAHERAFGLYWRWRSRHRGGQPPLDPELIALIRQMSLENPLWGAPRIHGELLKLGFHLSQSSVSKYMLRDRPAPGGSWAAFLSEHADAIASIDLLSAPTVTFGRLYAFLVLAHDRRRILHVEVTDHPNALWLACQIAQAFRRNPKPLFVVRDNDGLYGASFREALRAMGVRDRPTQPRSPWQNGHVERLIGSIRRECLDHQLIWNAAHLRRVFRAYADYYNGDRTHLSLKKDSPEPRPIEASGRIVSLPVLGGLHRRYRRRQPK